MLYRVWQNERGDTTLCPATFPFSRKRVDRMLLEFSASSWEDAQMQLHDKMGWEPFRPS
jgi:hypothetical protein